MFKILLQSLILLLLTACSSISLQQKEQEKTLKSGSAASRINSGEANSANTLKDLDQ